MDSYDDSLDYRRVEKAIRFIGERFRDQPTLDDVAGHLGMSSYHVQRLFKRWAGVSPKRFLQYVTIGHAKHLLRGADTVLEASYGSGLSGPSRLHDLFVTVEAVTPGEYRAGGEGVELRWGVHPTPFGPALFAETDRGVTSLAFVPPEGPAAALGALHADWPRAALRHAPEATGRSAQRIFGPRGSPAVRASDPHGEDGGQRLRLHVRGTNLQVRVWEALLRIPPAAVTTYEALARAIEKPGAARAVGTAVARNPVAVIIPCHRVIRKNGDFGDYRWGSARKRALLGWESARLGTGDEVDAA
jgi:AraC family transcriptional regulator of adaptative response/methylated-DNA-[protein]-cysteine methyltransferase